MKTSLAKDRKYVYWHTHRSLSRAMNLGYFWFKTRYRPALLRLEQANYKKDRVLFGESYCLIGQIFFMNGCPKAALKAYKKCLEYTPNHVYAMKELAQRYEEIGYYEKCMSVLIDLLHVDPVEFDRYLYRDALDSFVDNLPPFYEKTDIYWQAREKLAQDKPKAALRLLKKKRTIKAKLIKACAYAAMGETEKYFDQWHQVVNLKSPIQMTYEDWFYMEDSVWNGSAFWEIMLSCSKQNRFDSSVMPCFESLWDLDTKKSNSADPFNESKAQRSRRNKSHALLAQYHIVRTNRDLKLATKLANRYPNWPEIIELKDKMQSKIDLNNELLQEKKRQRAIEQTKKSLQKGRFVSTDE